MSVPPNAEFLGSGRFSLMRRLGAGGMGVVYEAHDRRHDARVAIKTIPHVDADAVYQLKTEFRAIAGVTHPNLVTLYELHAGDGPWFITMELVEGRPFHEHVTVLTAEEAEAPTQTLMTPAACPPGAGDAEATLRNGPSRPRLPAPACDLARLRPALGQLVAGVRAIHGSGKLHRDLKPSNVLVTDAGRVVILDFGIAADLPGARQPIELTSLPFAGTPRYMAPEQFGAADLTEKADWYAVGVMLFEALTGRSPFAAVTVGGLAREKATIEAAPPSAFADGVPTDLDSLCRDLLRPDPADRPGGEAIHARLSWPEALGSAGEATTGTRPAPAAVSTLVGREATLAALGHARALVGDGPVVVFLQGRSGMGKSTVLEAFLQSCAEERDTVTLSGRCYEAESVPFKALDVLMDSLARYLRRLSPPDLASLMPRRADALARMFPTLLRVPAFAEAPLARSAAKDAVEERLVASSALRELIGRLTDRTRLVVAIDDLQWGDLDSAVLLGDLLAPPDAPPMLLLVATRLEHAESHACLAYLRQPARQFCGFDVELTPLSGADVIDLQARLHPGADPLSSERAARIAADAAGNPFIIREVLDAGIDMEAGQEAVAGMIRQKVAHLDAPSRRLIEIVSLSAKPLDVSTACDAAGIGDDSQRILTRLRGLRLLRSEGIDERGGIETYHDRIRETVAASLGADRQLDGHTRLISALERRHPVDAEHLAFHLEGAGRVPEAAALFAAAAQQASQALAFDHAVTLYERALGLGTGQPDGTLVARLAEALAEAGRSAEAAERFAEAARLVNADTRRAYTRRAAYYYCISGRIDEGKAALGEVLGHFHTELPKSAGGAIASVLWARARLWWRGLTFQPRSPDDLSPDVRERLDTLWAAAIGLGNTEVISGIGFSTRGLLQALDAGDPARIVRAMCWEACLRAVDDVHSAARLVERAEMIIPSCETPYLRGMVLLARAIHTINLSRWRDAVPLFDEAEALWLEHGHGVDWEVNTARHFCSWALLYSGEFGEARRRMAIQQRLAAERGNRYMTVSMGAYAEPLGLLAAGKPAAARARRAEVMPLWTDQHFNVQHVLALLAEIQASLYEGRGRQALAAARRESAAAHEHGFDRLAVGRISTDYLTLNSLFLTMDAEGPRADLLPEAHRAIRRLEKETTPWGPASAHAGRAGIALAKGDRAGAAEHLRQAGEAFQVLGMTGFACAARRGLGRVLGGDRGHALVAEADEWLVSHGVADPEAFSPVCIHVPRAGEGP